MNKPNINGFIKWIENNKDEETGEYRIPRTGIYDKNRKRNLYIEEMTEDEKKEVKYGIWWASYPIQRKIYEKYVNVQEEKIPEKYRKFMKKMKEILPSNNKFEIKEYLKWIKNNKYEITGIHKKPRITIIKNGRTLTIKEMTKDERIETKLGGGFFRNIKERKICEEYTYVKIEDVPEEYREMIEIIKSTSVFPKYIEWRKNHFNEETGEYEEPRMVIIRDGVKIKPEDMTFEEKEESEIAYIWRFQSDERKIIKKYKEKEIYDIPEIYREIVELFCSIDKKTEMKSKEVTQKPNKISIIQEDNIIKEIKSNNKIKEFLQFIKDNKYEITGIHKKPRITIYRNGKLLQIKEMTESEKKEYDLGRWWNQFYPKERMIYEKYIYVKIEDVPEEYREMVEIIRSTSVFPKYIEWRENHFNEETGEYKEPRMIIKRDAVIIKPEDMTFEEKEEAEIAYLWKNRSDERKIIKKYETKDIEQIPEFHRNMVKQFMKVNEKSNKKNNAINEEITRMRLCVKKYFEDNNNVRNELSEIIRDEEER